LTSSTARKKKEMSAWKSRTKTKAKAKEEEEEEEEEEIEQNGIAFELAKKWLKIAKENQTYSNERWFEESKREEADERLRDSARKGHHGRLGVGAKFSTHSKQKRIMEKAVQSKGVFKKIEIESRQRHEREQDLRRAMMDDSDSDSDVRGKSNTTEKKKRKVEAFSLDTFRDQKKNKNKR